MWSDNTPVFTNMSTIVNFMAFNPPTFYTKPLSTKENREQQSVLLMQSIKTNKNREIP